MKNLPFHLIYISIIAILGFQLWSKTTVSNQAFEEIERVLDRNSEILNADIENLRSAIVKNYDTNPNYYRDYFSKSKEVLESAKSKVQIIDKMLLTLKHGNTVTLNAIKDSIQDFSTLILQLERSRDSSELANQFLLRKMINSDTFKNGIKTLPALHLRILKEQLLLDEIAYLKYARYKTTEQGLIFNSYGVVIAPKKAALIEGEKFEADVCLIRYSSNPNSSAIFIANNDTLKVREGVGHFTKIEKTVGVKTLKVKASILNPLTGELRTMSNEYEYNVLPKCSRDCQ